MEAGKNYNLKPGHTSSIRRIEGAMLSYHADADIYTNPFEVGLDRLVSFDTDVNYIGKDALKKIKQDGIKRKHLTQYWRILIITQVCLGNFCCVLQCVVTLKIEKVLAFPVTQKLLQT